MPFRRQQLTCLAQYRAGIGRMLCREAEAAGAFLHGASRTQQTGQEQMGIAFAKIMGQSRSDFGLRFTEIASLKRGNRGAQARLCGLFISRYFQ